MDRTNFIKNMDRILGKAYQELDLLEFRPTVGVDADIEAYYGVDEDGYIIINGYETGINVYDVNNIRYSASADEQIVAIYYYLGMSLTLIEELDVASGEKRFFLRSRYNATEVRDTTLYYRGWTVTDEFCIADSELLLYGGGHEYVEVPEGVDTIGKAAFKDNTGIRKIVLPECCTLIKERAFEGTKSLKEINLDKVVTLDCTAFYGSGINPEEI